MAPINGEITFGSLVHHNGRGTISTYVKAVINVQEKDDKAFIISINDHKLDTPIELFAEEVTTPGTYRWSTQNGEIVTGVAGKLVYLHSAELVQTNGTHFAPPSAESQAVDSNRQVGEWYADATVTFGNDGQQTFRDAIIIADE